MLLNYCIAIYVIKLLQHVLYIYIYIYIYIYVYSTNYFLQPSVYHNPILSKCYM